MDVNTADPAVLAAVGLTPDAIGMVLQRRRAAPLTIREISELASVLGPAAAFLRIEGNSIINIRATARVLLPNGQLSDLKRTVAAQVKYMPQGFNTYLDVLRWYDTAWSN